MKYLKFWRLVREKSQAEIARYAGISQGHYCDIEKRGIKPRDPKLYGKLAEAIDRPIEELIGKLHNVNPSEMVIPGHAAK